MSGSVNSNSRGLSRRAFFCELIEGEQHHSGEESER